MSMRPIDLQVIMPKTTEAAKAHQVAKDSNEALQNLLSAQFKEQLKQAKEKVYEKTKAEEIKIESHEENKKEKSKNKQGKNKKRSFLKNQNHIDMRI